jgi:uncharacterized protein (DUF697 family)
MMKSFLVLFAVAAALAPFPTTEAVVLECSCVPFMVMFSKQFGNDCFSTSWVRDLIHELAMPTLKGWEGAHPCGTGGGNATTTGIHHALATSYKNSTNALQEESEGYIAGSQQGYLIGINQGFELGK